MDNNEASKRYLHIGAIVLGISGTAAIYLNFQGVTCLTDLAREGRSTIMPDRLNELERNCFIITNSYVYSLFGVIIGIILIMLWYLKKRRSIRDRV